MQPFSITRKICEKEITIETGYLAKQAAGSTLVTMGGTQILATVTMSNEKSNLNFFPLSVDYIEKFYAGGKIPGSYNRREGKPSDHEVLVSRLIDRPIRPLFEAGFRNEVQVVVTVLSIDGKNPSDIPSLLGAFASLLISSIPFRTPLAAVRMGKVGDTLIVNPTYEELEKSSLDLIVAGKENAITMIEGGAKEVSEETLLLALEKAQSTINEIVSFISEIHKQVAKEKKAVVLNTSDPVLKKFLQDNYYESLQQALKVTDKKDREEKIHTIYREAKEELEEKEEFEVSKAQAGAFLYDFQSDIVRSRILKEKKRIDGRDLNEIRPLDLRVDLLQKAHGSAVFTRGETQALAVVSLGSNRAQQKIDITRETFQKRFFLHYNFPPFCVGEVGRLTSTSRREIGHGMLAEKSIEPILPSKEKFNFTIRLVSEVLESNGSSSMATVCASSLALMDAGIPIKKHVAGISMGLVMDGSKNDYCILTDIQGIEDSLGDMDFKVAGTRDGITGFQLDLKVDGITIEIMKEALIQAKQARMTVLDKMEASITAPKNMKASAPRHHVLSIRVDKIKNLIGVGGKNIKEIVESTGSDVEVADDGSISIFASDDAALQKTIGLVEHYTGVPKIGKVYEGKVKSIMPFGAFVEVLPGVDGLCHISNLANHKVNRVEDVLSIGEMASMKVTKIDEKGRISLDHRGLQSEDPS